MIHICIHLRRLTQVGEVDHNACNLNSSNTTLYEQRHEKICCFVCVFALAKSKSHVSCEHDGEHLCLCYKYRPNTLFNQSEISSIKSPYVAVQPCLCWTWSETAKTGFRTMRLLIRAWFELLKLYTLFLAHPSRRLIGELKVYPCSGVRPSSSSSVHHISRPGTIVLPKSLRFLKM